MQRPLGITVTAILMVANVVCDVYLSVTAPYLRGRSANPNGPSPLMIGFHIALAGAILFQFACVFFYWLGKAWARWAILVGCLFYLISMRKVVTDWNQNHRIGLLTSGAGILSVYLLWYLHTEHVREWFARPKPGKA